jgi:hypothetical protein
MTLSQYAVARVAEQFRLRLLAGEQLSEHEQGCNETVRDAVLRYEKEAKPKCRLSNFYQTNHNR